MKAIRKAHEVECIQYNGNPEEVVEFYNDHMDDDAVFDTDENYMWIATQWGQNVIIDEGNWLILSGFRHLVVTDKEFKEQYD